MRRVDWAIHPKPPRIWLCEDRAAFRRGCIRLDLNEVPEFPSNKAATTWLMHDKRGDLVCLVCLSPEKIKKYSKVEICGLLVHEAVHVWQGWAEHIGEEHPGAEQEAYAVQWVSVQLINAWKKL